MRVWADAVCAAALNASVAVTEQSESLERHVKSPSSGKGFNE
jgi:hypothetical protein